MELEREYAVYTAPPPPRRARWLPTGPWSTLPPPPLYGKASTSGPPPSRWVAIRISPFPPCVGQECGSQFQREGRGQLLLEGDWAGETTRPRLRPYPRARVGKGRQALGVVNLQSGLASRRSAAGGCCHANHPGSETCAVGCWEGFKDKRSALSPALSSSRCATVELDSKAEREA